MGEFLYQVMFMNGKAVRFYADNCEECQTQVVFYVDGAVVASFNETVIAGYMILGVNDNDN